MSEPKGIPLIISLRSARERLNEQLRRLSHGGSGQTHVNRHSPLELGWKRPQVQPEKMKMWVPWHGLIVIGKRVELLGRNTQKPRMWDPKVDSENWRQQGVGKAVLREKAGSQESTGSAAEAVPGSARLGKDSSREIWGKQDVKRKIGAESKAAGMTAESRKESASKSTGDKVGTSGEDLRSREYQLQQKEEQRLSGEELVYRGEKRGSTGEKRGSTGEKRASTGEKRGSTGEKRGSTGEKRGSTGEKRGSTGEKRGSTGEKPGSNGEKPGSNGEKRGSNGEKRGSNGEKRGSSEENAVYRREKRGSSGEKLRSSREKMRLSREKLRTEGEDSGSIREKLGSSEEKLESNGEKLSTNQENIERVIEITEDERGIEITEDERGLEFTDEMEIPSESIKGTEKELEGIEEGVEAEPQR